jgi:hypothetical protein
MLLFYPFLQISYRAKQPFRTNIQSPPPPAQNFIKTCLTVLDLRNNKKYLLFNHFQDCTPFHTKYSYPLNILIEDRKLRKFPKTTL